MDTAVPMSAVRTLGAALPGAVVHEIDAGHLINLEAPQAIADAIRETVARASW